MSLTLTKVRDSEDVWGKTRTVLFDVAFDTSYPLSAGYVINAGDVGLKNIFSARAEGGNKAAGAVLPVLDLGTPAGIAASSAILRLFLPSGGATAPATLTAPVVAANGAPGLGTLAVTTTPDAGATNLTGSAAKPALAGVFSGALAAGSAGAATAGIGKEVGDTTDVSSITVRVRFFGN